MALPTSSTSEATMARCSRRITVVAVGATLAAAAGAADTNGPMSSTRAPVEAASAAPAPFNVQALFANTCGWCHSGAGRVAGKGPQLMGTSLTDAEIVYRVKNGKTGAMPAFGSSFNDEQIKAIVSYIRELKPEAAAQ
jgi:mono/diheme cytochrome c family protein